MTHADSPETGPARLILASKSPRRRAMLEQAGIAFECADAVDDGGLLPGSADAEHWVAALAFLKAWSVARELAVAPGEPAVVLGADTVCVSEGRLLGKPSDASDARDMLRGFPGRTHQVLTGVALVSPSGERELLVDAADVTWGSVDSGAIDRYVDSGGWRGKAGGYNLSERINDGWPIVCEGDPATVMGLPMRRLVARFDAWSIPAGSAA
ncbi:MAG: Maf family protein [Planctomycetota bacterium]